MHFQSFFVDDETINRICKKHIKEDVVRHEIIEEDKIENAEAKETEVVKKDEVVNQIYDLNGGDQIENDR